MVKLFFNFHVLKTYVANYFTLNANYLQIDIRDGINENVIFAYPTKQYIGNYRLLKLK